MRFPAAAGTYRGRPKPVHTGDRRQNTPTSDDDCRPAPSEQPIIDVTAAESLAERVIGGSTARQWGA
jgi:hypothetical protein